MQGCTDSTVSWEMWTNASLPQPTSTKAPYAARLICGGIHLHVHA